MSKPLPIPATMPRPEFVNAYGYRTGGRLERQTIANDNGSGRPWKVCGGMVPLEGWPDPTMREAVTRPTAAKPQGEAAGWFIGCSERGWPQGSDRCW